MRALLLGPHPQDGSFSILNYFHFYQSQLPNALPDWSIASESPGRCNGGNHKVRSYTRMRTRWENFVEWPLYLTRVRTDLIHVVDQGLAWYGTFLQKGKRMITVHDLISYMTWK